MNLLKLLCFVLLLWSPLSAKPSNNLSEGMLLDLEFIKQSFQAGYAPAEWKKKHFGWDLNAEIKSAKSQVLGFQERSTSIKKFHRVLKKFFQSTQDYHVTALFYSTESASLPFRIQEAEGKYYFTYINRAKLPAEDDFPFNVGDELLSFGHLPVNEALKELRENEIGINNHLTDCALAEIYLTNRFGRLGHQVPHGQINIAGCKIGSKTPITYTMKWRYSPEKIGAPPNYLAKHLMKASQLEERGFNNYFLKQFVIPQYETLVTLKEEDEDDTEVLGSRKSFVPNLGTIIWEADKEAIFHAYIFDLEDGKIGGYIRIPSYVPDDVEEAIAEFESLISTMEQTVDALVIDQVNNPGGYLLYVYGLASMLSDKPLTVPKHRLTLTQEDIYYANLYMTLWEDIETDEEAKETLDGFINSLPINLDLVKGFLDHFHFVDEEWKSGKHLTRPCYLYGIGPLQPHPKTHYTKPLLVLVNQLDFSGGDFFPAILQDSGRATIMGMNTAGAGGFLAKVDFPNMHGISTFSFTASIAERSDEILIENQGVKPDVPYVISKIDLQNNYVDYVKKVRQTLYEISVKSR